MGLRKDVNDEKMAKKIEALLVASPYEEGNRKTIVGTSEGSPWEFGLAEDEQAANSPALGYGRFGVGSWGTFAVAASKGERCSVHHAADWERVGSCSAQPRIPSAGLA